MDLQRARTFATVVARGSVAAAADALGYTQSAVSQQLSTLERDIGLTLVDRSRRPLRPTPAGAEILPEVEALIERAGAVDAAIRDVRELERGRVELVAFPSALATVVPTVISRFRTRHPGIEIGVRQAETDAALAALRGGTAEVAVVHVMEGQELDGDDGRLARASLGDDELHVVLPAGHELARRERIRMADLIGRPLVAPRADGPAAPFRALVERLFDAVDGPASVAYEVDDLRGAQAFAAAGLGIVLMHGLTLPPVADGVVVRPLDAPHGRRRIEAIRATGRRVPAARAFWDELVATRLPAVC
jgi:DNA-binding transcriptional LysR family regulator